MPNAIPTGFAVNYKGSGTVQVFPLLNGITLDAQDGSDVGNASPPALEAISATTMNNQGNRACEAFGKRYVLHGFRVYEKDEGGAGLWDEVTGLALSPTSPQHSGLHVLYPAGVETLAFLCEITNNLHAVHTTDGVNWTDTDTGLVINALTSHSGSIVFRDAIFWRVTGSVAANRVKSYDFNLGAVSSFAPTGSGNGANTNGAFCIHQGELFFVEEQQTDPKLFRLDGSVFTFVIEPQTLGSLNIASVMGMFSDGFDIILMGGTAAAGVIEAFRLSDVLLGGSPSSTTITSPVLNNFPASAITGFFPSIASHPDPSTAEQRAYIQYRQGNNNTGSFDPFLFLYRRITTGTHTGSYVLGETVTGGTSGATGIATDIVIDTSLSLTDVVGTFQNGETLTGDGGATSTSSSTLDEQAATAQGAGISAVNFGILVTTQGGLERIPTKGTSRLAFSGPASEIAGARRRTMVVYGTGADVDAALFFHAGSEAPDKRGTIVGVSIASVPVTTGLVGNLGELALEALSPATGDAYVVTALDGDSSLTPGALAIAVGDIVEFDGVNWVFVHETTTTGFPDLGTHATLNATTALIAPYTDGVDEGKLAAFDGTILTGIFVTTPTLVSNEARNLTPTNGATLINIDHDASADGLSAGDRHSVALDIV